jgi:deoxyadenosine/deoxycytidine kinase
MENAISPDYLTELQNAYFDYFKSEKNTPVLVLDLQSVNYLTDVAAFDRIVRLLGVSYAPGVHYLQI